MKHILKTMSGYRREWLRGDLLSGIVIAAVSIPISMGYAQIAGLPAVYGLYGSVLPVLVFALFSTSPQFMFGVDAAPAAMVGSVLAGMGVTLGSPEAQRLVPVLTFYTGVWLLAFSLMRAGKTLNYISAPVMGGFISGICCTIILMQLPKLMGGTAGTGELFELAEHLLSACRSVHPLSLALGLAALAILLTGKKLLPKFPMAIVMMAVGAAASAGFHLAERGVACLAAVEPGLPALRLPDLRALSPVQGLGSSLSIAVVIMAETLLAESSFAMRHDVALSDNREILTFSLANLAACLVGCCPVNGSVSRSSMNEQFRGRTQLVSVVAAALMAAVLLFFTGFIRFLPVPVLTAIVISALLGAVEFDVARRLLRANRREFAIFMAAFLGVLVLGTIHGVIIGALLSFADVIQRASQPQRDFLGVISGRPGVYPIDRMSEAHAIDGVVLYRFSGSLFFANITLFQQDIERSVGPDTRAVIVDASGIVGVDISACDRLLLLYRKLKGRGVRFYLTEHIGQVNDELRRFGAGELIDEGAVRRTLYGALLDCGAADEQMLPEALRSRAAELLRQRQEFEWAYGEDAEQRMEALAGELLNTLAHTEQARRGDALETLLHSIHWRGEIDRDALLARLEQHLQELSGLMELPEDEVLARLERRRARVTEQLRREHPELLAHLVAHREELEARLRAHYPQAAAHIDELRARQQKTE